MSTGLTAAKAAELQMKLFKAEAAVAALEERNKELVHRLERSERRCARYKLYLMRFVKLVNAVRLPVEEAGGRDLVEGMLAKGVPPTYRVRDMAMSLGQLRSIHDVLAWWDENRP